MTEQPPLLVCPICGTTLPDHTGGADLEHDDDGGHTYTPGPLPDDVAWVPWFHLDDDDG